MAGQTVVTGRTEKKPRALLSSRGRKPLEVVSAATVHPESDSCEIFDVPGAAAFAKVSEQRIREWIDNGLAYFQCAVKEHGSAGPSGYLILREHIVAYIKARLVKRVPMVEPATEADAPVQAGRKPADGKLKMKTVPVQERMVKPTYGAAKK